MKKIDESKEAFDIYKVEYKKYTSEDLSEADTRSKLIDNVLCNVLGWAEEDIRREKHLDSGYYDYKISLPGIFFLVEAKRQFNELKLPINHKTATISALMGGNEEVIEQIRKYAYDEGVSYGIITNGYQYSVPQN